jgi:hypothetical protein
MIGGWFGRDRTVEFALVAGALLAWGVAQAQARGYGSYFDVPGAFTPADTRQTLWLVALFGVPATLIAYVVVRLARAALLLRSGVGAVLVATPVALGLHADMTSRISAFVAVVVVGVVVRDVGKRRQAPRPTRRPPPAWPARWCAEVDRAAASPRLDTVARALRVAVALLLVFWTAILGAYWYGANEARTQTSFRVLSRDQPGERVRIVVAVTDSAVVARDVDQSTDPHTGRPRNRLLRGVIIAPFAAAITLSREQIGPVIR